MSISDYCMILGVVGSIFGLFAYVVAWGVSIEQRIKILERKDEDCDN